jgi:protein-S-isoprenylcysteine O-methyltransferase Ste14
MYSYSLNEKLRGRIFRIMAALFLIIIPFSAGKWDTQSSIRDDIFFLIGCILVAFGALGRVWCSLYISGYKNNTLITQGAYSMLRNPLYFFSLIAITGVGLVTKTLLIPLAFLVLFAAYYPGLIKSEEKRLLMIHGEGFKEYAKSTPSFIPKMSLLKEPEAYTVNPGIFKREIYRAFWFVSSIGIIGLLKALHEAGIIPVYLHIY